MTLTLVDPTVQVAAAGKSMAPPIADLSGCTIGLLTNGKENADRLLELTAAHFVQTYNCRLLTLQDKRNASRPCPPDMLAGIAEDADILLTAVGD